MTEQPPPSPFYWPHRALAAEAERDRYRDALIRIEETTTEDAIREIATNALGIGLGGSR